MVYGRNLRPGMVINHHETGWGVVDRAVPFGSDNAHADVWMVGASAAVTMRLVTAARLSPALRSVAALARKLGRERDVALRRVAELEVAVEPEGARRLELAKKLAVSAGNLLRIERDDARARAERLEVLLVQAEDYARGAGSERDEAESLLDAAVDRAESAERRVAELEAALAVRFEGSAADRDDRPAASDLPDSEIDAVIRRVGLGWTDETPVRPEQRDYARRIHAAIERVIDRTGPGVPR
jgi:hypothetical protein